MKDGGSIRCNNRIELKDYEAQFLCLWLELSSSGSFCGKAIPSSTMSFLISIALAIFSFVYGLIFSMILSDFDILFLLPPGRSMQSHR